MKSAFELALERSGGSLNEIDDLCKEQLAEVENKMKAKLAEIDISYANKFATANQEERQQLEEDKAVEIASAKSQAARDKKAIRGG